MSGELGSLGYGIPSEARAPSARNVTLSSGATFVICSSDATITPGGEQGFYADDTRLLDRWTVHVDGAQPRVLATQHDDQCLRVVAAVGDQTRPALLVSTTMRIGTVLSVVIRLEHLASAERDVAVDVGVSSDFADLFDVKRDVRPRGGMVAHGAVDDNLVLRYLNLGFRRGLTVQIDGPATVLRDGLHVTRRLGPYETVELEFTATPARTGNTRRVASPAVQSEWRDSVPAHPRDCIVPARIWKRSWDDLATLLMDDPLAPGGVVVAAGSPWFMALFGRDSLVTCLETLPYRNDLATGVLGALAARQGARRDPVSLEQPGRIAHEVRRGEVVQRSDGWGSVFYGTVDATPLFVMTLAMAMRNGMPLRTVVDLLPAAERAVEWMLNDGDPDGDGFIEYPGVVHGSAGLANQGWKDSDDAIRHPDGSLAEGPIALVEVQGYCHAALVALAELHDATGGSESDSLRLRATQLQSAIDERFWLDELDCYALALDGDKRPVATVSSNAGHLLFTRTATGERGHRLARRLMADDMFTGFGLRTLSSTNGGYNPLSYHCGSVWPHDTALVAAGMFEVEPRLAHRLAAGLLDAADDDGRLPELFGGFARRSHPRPVPYPTSCSPQAWAAGAPLLLASRST